MTALRGARLIGGALDRERQGRDPAALALGAILCGYAIDSAGLGLHHVVCQTLVRICGTPHAETNAEVLPHALAFLAERVPTSPTKALRLPSAPTCRACGCGSKRWAGLGTWAPWAGTTNLDEALGAMLQRPELGRVPDPPVTHEDLERIVQRAW